MNILYTAKIHEHNQHNGATALCVSFTTVCYTFIVHVSSANEWSILHRDVHTACV